jgi:GDP-mannose 4,6-dehydratase
MDIKNCRICGCVDLKKVIYLGEQYITSRFPLYGDWSTPKTEITLLKCQNCSLIQLKETTKSSELYEYEYGYRSGISNTMREHLYKYQQEMISIVHELKENDTVVDIGSNDSTLLQYYSDNLKRIGVDPTGNQFKKCYGKVELIPTYFTFKNFRDVYDQKVKIISSISMFYDLPDPIQFAKDIYNVLDDNGIWTCEQSYMPTMIKRNSIDTICHEHLEYYALHQVKYIADKANMKIIHLSFNDCNGGSFRIYFAKKESMYNEATELIKETLKQENEFGIHSDELYINFMNQCDYEIYKLKEFTKIVNQNNKQIWIYGASTKGNCLLQYGNIKESDMKYAVERNLDKVGKMTSTGIKIISEEKMRENPPEYLLVLPWHFKDEIIKRESEFLEKGGQLIFPFPTFDIVGNKEKLLITGSNGQISQYVQQVCKDYTLYGISSSLNQSNLTTFSFDMKDTKQLELVLDIIKPNVIVHLASISSSLECFNNPILALQTNGMITANICDIIYRKGLKTKLFHASSSEIYKGHVNYTVKEDDTYMYHLHPYSIAKTMAHNIVDFYRTTYDLPFSNGIMFTTESPLKSEDFLLNKVAKHAKNTEEVLVLGNLDSYRNIIHSFDAATAIHLICKQDKGDNYIICNDESVKISDVVIDIYKTSGINVVYDNQNIVEKETNKIIATTSTRLGDNVCNIKGCVTKLKNLGWKPTLNIKDIVQNITE